MPYGWREDLKSLITAVIRGGGPYRGGYPSETGKRGERSRCFLGNSLRQAKGDFECSLSALDFLLNEKKVLFVKSSLPSIRSLLI